MLNISKIKVGDLVRRENSNYERVISISYPSDFENFEYSFIFKGICNENITTDFIDIDGISCCGNNILEIYKRSDE